MTDRLESLLALHELQRKAMAVFVRAESEKAAGRIAEAANLYTQEIALTEEYLATTESYNQTFPPMDVDTIVQPLVNALFVSADLEQQLGHRDVAESRRGRALSLSTKYFGEAGDAEALRSRAASLILEARFNEALVALMKARAYVERVGDLVGILRVTIDIVDIYQWLGDYARAKAELSHAAELFKGRVPDTPSTVTAIFASVIAMPTSGTIDASAFAAVMETAQLYRASQELKYYQGLIGKALGEWDAAEAAFRAIREQYAQLGVGAAIDYQLAAIGLERGKFTEVLALTVELERSFTGLMRPKLAGLHRIRAKALIGLGRDREAQSLLRKAIDDLTEYNDLDLLWKLQEALGDSLARSADTDSALAMYVSMVATLSVLRRAPLGHRFDSTYLADKIPALQRAISLACRAERPKEAWRLIEFVKSRTLTATLSIPNRPEATEDTRRFDEVTRELDAVEYQLFKQNNAALRRKRDDLRKIRELLLERIRIADPRWRNLTQPISFDLAGTELLVRARKQSLLSLYMAPDGIVSALITPAGTFVGQVPFTQPLRQALSNYVENLQSRVPQPEAYDTSIAFGQLVPPSIARKALAYDSLIVIPHHELHLLPWACLHHGDQRLFQHCPVGVLPNASSYRLLATTELPAKGGLLAVAPDYRNAPKLDAVGSEKDLRDLRSLFESKSRLLAKPLFGAEVTEAAVRDMLQLNVVPGGVAHICCHESLFRKNR